MLVLISIILKLMDIAKKYGNICSFSMIKKANILNILNIVMIIIT